jgi:two-component system OmpR family sensor kinase
VKFGLRTKLTLLYAALFAVVLGLLGAFFYHAMAARLDTGVTDELDQRAAGLRGYINFVDGKPTLVYDRDDPEETHFIRLATRYYQIYDAADGHLVERSREMDLLDVDLSPDEVAERIAEPGIDEFDTESDRLRFHNSVLRAPDRHVYLLRVGASLGPLQATLRELKKTLELMIPAAVFVAALGGWFMARLALRPVGELRRAAHRISISNLDRRLPQSGTGDELDLLAATFNNVFERLQKSVEQMREFSVSISHELRTPLTALQGEAEITLMRASTVEDYRRVLTSQLEELGKLSRLVNQLLTLARAESGQLKLEAREMDLSEMVRSLAEQMEPIASYSGIRLAVTGAEPGTWIAADPQWLERVVLNLLDNAIKFTHEGGSVEVAVTRANGEARLQVRDTGAGIPQQALPHIFERFYRADGSRSKEVAGVGLGLSLVRSIVQAHRGRVEVQSELNVGSTFTVVLPLARAGAEAVAEPSGHLAG